MMDRTEELKEIKRIAETEDLTAAREEEFANLMQSFQSGDEDAADTVKNSLDKASRRNRKRKMILAPIETIAAMFVLFTLTVNVSAPAVNAAEHIPGLKTLCELVRLGDGGFSDSVEDAVNNGYVEEQSQTIEDNGFTFYLDSVIADDAQVKLFYLIKADDDTLSNYRSSSTDSVNYEFSVTIKDGEGNQVYPSFTLHENGTELEDASEPSEMSLDFDGEEIPSELNFEIPLDIYGTKDDQYQCLKKEAATFSFTVQIPEEMQDQKEITKTNIPLNLDGQKYTITSIESYPTYLQLNIEADKNNTKWLRELEYTIQDDQGNEIDSITNGVTAILGGDHEEVSAVRSESAWFKDADSLNLMVHRAYFEDKVHDDLVFDPAAGTVTGESDLIDKNSIRLEQEDGNYILSAEWKKIGDQMSYVDLYTTDGEPVDVIDYAISDEGQNTEYVCTGTFTITEKQASEKTVLHRTVTETVDLDKISVKLK